MGGELGAAGCLSPRTRAADNAPPRPVATNYRPRRPTQQWVKGLNQKGSTLACGVPPLRSLARVAVHAIRRTRPAIGCDVAQQTTLETQLHLSISSLLSLALGLAALSASLRRSLALSFPFGQALLVRGNRWAIAAHVPPSPTPTTLFVHRHGPDILLFPLLLRLTFHDTPQSPSQQDQTRPSWRPCLPRRS